MDPREYTLKGFQCFTAKLNDSSRGVVIYVKDTISAEYCKVLNDTEFCESVWCTLRLENKNLLLGGIYKSPSSNLENHRNLNRLISQASSMNFDHLVILGDFNFPEIDWSTWTVNKNETHPSFLFVECLRDNYLGQHINDFTRYRQGQDPSCLDLLLTDNQTEVENLSLNGELGASDHVSVFFEFPCKVNKITDQSNRLNFFKGDYSEIKSYLNTVNWNEMVEMDVEDSWTFLRQHLNHCFENFVPNYGKKKGIQKPKWMDYYCVRKVKKKYQAWKRFTYSRSYRDYQTYCKLRNSATQAIRYSKRKYQKGVAERSKTNQKSFWSFVKGETQSRSGIGDLKDSDGNIATETIDKANILNDFFATVFTREDNSELPEFPDKLDSTESISDVTISPDMVLKHLKALNTAKACGPDDCHPFFLKQCAEELYIPLSDIFQKSVSTGVLPHDWKLANVTCIFKKGVKSEPGNYRPASLTSVVCKLP